MIAKIISGAIQGVDGLRIQVEVDLARGLPRFSIVGLPEAAVRESKDRVMAAIKNSDFEFPLGRITVNLAPAAVKKEGAGYDLPMAIGILVAAGQLDYPHPEQVGIIGELSLDGRIQAVRGILPITLSAKDAGLKTLIVPKSNSEEAAVASGPTIIPVTSLRETVAFLNQTATIRPLCLNPATIFQNANQYTVDFNEVSGQEHVKRGLEIAAAGGHNLLMNGAPGSGKTMMARRLPTILPDVSQEEALETSKIYSSSGLLAEDTGLLTTRPFRAPHHTITNAGLIGGGMIPRPGEVSLAHNGVLFLDELPEFRQQALELMRQPLEDGQVTLARVASRLCFPARFMLVAAMNPCPCGYLSERTHRCCCRPSQVQRYQNRLSGPFLDRIDLHIEVPPVPLQEISTAKTTESSATIRARVNRARQTQQQRFQGQTSRYANSHMSGQALKQLCPLSSEGQQLLLNAIDRLGLSARAYHKTWKIAQTIADLAGEKKIQVPHIAEAIQYRQMTSDH